MKEGKENAYIFLHCAWFPLILQKNHPITLFTIQLSRHNDTTGDTQRPHGQKTYPKFGA